MSARADHPGAPATDPEARSCRHPGLGQSSSGPLQHFSARVRRVRCAARSSVRHCLRRLGRSRRGCCHSSGPGARSHRVRRASTRCYRRCLRARRVDHGATRKRVGDCATRRATSPKDRLAAGNIEPARQPQRDAPFLRVPDPQAGRSPRASEAPRLVEGQALLVVGLDTDPLLTCAVCTLLLADHLA